MNTLSILSTVAAFCVGFISGRSWQREKYRRGLTKLTGELRASGDALKTAVDNDKNTQTKG